MTDQRILALLKEADTAVRAGKTASARLTLNRVLRRDPGNIDAKFLLATTRVMEGNLIEASALVNDILTTDKLVANPAAAGRLADLCMQCELWFDAARLYAPLCEMKPDAESLRFLAGTACFKAGQLETASSHFRKCIELEPRHAASYLRLGYIHRAWREFDEAERLFREYLEHSGDSKANGYWALADLRRMQIDNELIDQMTRYIDDGAENSDEVSVTHFALGVAAEQRKDYKSAFTHFQAANDIQEELRPFLYRPFKQLVDGLLAAPEQEARAAKVTGGRPIFIVGLPRSGTTLVEQILAAHSVVVPTDELPFMDRIALELERGGGYGSRLAALSDEEVARYRARYLREARQYAPDLGSHFIDKSPQNFLHIGLIQRLLPEACIIYLQRDLRDNAISLYRQLFATGNTFSSSFDDIESYAVGCHKLMNHWLKQYPDAIRVQGYEALVNDPDTEIAALLDHCELDHETSCFEFYKSKQAVKTPSAGQVSLPMYTSSIGQWQHYETWLAEEFARLGVLQRSESD